MTESLKALGKRSQTLMFLRESMYRLSEMSLNREITAAQMIVLYEKTLDSAAELQMAELELSKQQEQTELAAAHAHREESKATAAKALQNPSVLKDPELVDNVQNDG